MSDRGRIWDDEALSAHLDGEVAPPDSLRKPRAPADEARLAELRAVAETVGGAVPPVEAATRDAMIARALDGWDTEGARPDELAAARRRARWSRVADWRVLAPVAALVLALVVAVPLVTGRDRDEQATTVALAPSKEADAARQAAGAEAPVMGGDLGDVADATALRARVGPLLAGTTQDQGEGGGTRAAGGAVGGQPAPSGNGASAFAASPALLEPPCTTKALAGGGTLILIASARWHGVAAAVLGVRPADAADPIRIEVRATEGCRLLATVTVEGEPATRR